MQLTDTGLDSQYCCDFLEHWNFYDRKKTILEIVESFVLLSWLNFSEKELLSDLVIM